MKGTRKKRLGTETKCRGIKAKSLGPNKMRCLGASDGVSGLAGMESCWGRKPFPTEKKVDASARA